MMQQKTGANILYLIYALNFLLAFSIAITAYVNSTFLGVFMEEKFVGVVFTVGSMLTLIAFANVQNVLRRFGNYNTAVALLVAQFALLITIAIAKSIWVVVPAFILFWTIIPLLKFSLDVFLESFSADATTGKTRGLFFTAANIAWISAPAVAGAVLTNSDYWKIYIAAAAFLLPIIYLTQSGLRDFKDPRYDHVPFKDTLKVIKRNANIFRILATNVLLYFFYSWMVIYAPIYLHEHIGFTWAQLGPMFTIMLLPFLLLEFPAGRLADVKWGEKEMLSIGFIIAALSVAALSFITSTNFWVWAGALFVTRIGASLIEIMNESYFFKQIDGTDAHIIGIFRNSRSLAYIISPIVASIFLYFFDLKYLFVLLGVIMLLGLRYSLAIKDTR